VVTGPCTLRGVLEDCDKLPKNADRPRASRYTDASAKADDRTPSRELV
jgi:hypothetical protein